MTASYIIAARRSAVVPRNGAFAALDFHALAAPVIKAILADAGLDGGDVGEIIASNALGAGGNPARLIALAAGLPDSVGGLSIDRQCCGGLDALLLADAMIRSGQKKIVIAGGVESYSRRPLRSRTFADGTPPEPYEQAAFTPWPENDPDMADAADRLANKLGITRQMQDDWAIESHRKALVSAETLQQEMVALEDVSSDPFARSLSPKLCERATVVSGTITAANMCVAADGAAFCLVVSEDLADRFDDAKVRIAGGVTLGDDPLMPGLAPVAAIKSVLSGLQIAPSDLASAEIMEAFAVQAIACQRGANINPAIVNPDGGALARGHPIGASGAILAVRLFHHLNRTGGTGLAAIAAAGGLGTSLVLKS